VVIGQQKGRDTRSKIRRNFGMPRPEGYRKALRLMKLAERFQLPLFTFIDTPGAYPGVGAEERGQSEAIARNLLEMAELRIPGHLHGDRRRRLRRRAGDRRRRPHADAPVQHLLGDLPGRLRLDPVEECRQGARRREALGLTANRLLEHKLIDRIVSEPLGGAHRDPVAMAATLKKVLLEELAKLERVDTPELLEQRYRRLRSYGAYEAA
jgi:acetyl-CoA carboxylase carboxyl transferase subunit alpha